MLPDWLTQDAVAVVVGGVGIGLWRVHRFIRGQGDITAASLTAVFEALRQQGDALKAFGVRLVEHQKSVDRRIERQDAKIQMLQAELKALTRPVTGNGDQL